MDVKNGKFYLKTYYDDYLHGPVYVMYYSGTEIEYLGSYNYGYMDGWWHDKDFYKKGTILKSKNKDGIIEKQIRSEYHDIAYKLREDIADFLLESVSDDNNTFPVTIENNYII